MAQSLESAPAHTFALIQGQLAEAALGSGDACYELGIVFSSGASGVDVDRVAAHKWFNIAALRGSVEGQQCRSEIAGEMSRHEIAEAQRQARAWLSSCFAQA